MWTLLLLALLPTSLVIADVDPVTPPTPLTDESSVTVYEAPKSETAPVIQSARSRSFDLHLKPSLTSPVAMSASENDLVADAQDTGIVEGGLKWMSVERPVTLTGFVDKSAVDKNLDVARGATVWSNEQKSAQLTIVNNPSDVRLLEVDRMGRVEVKEPRVLYYGIPMAAVTTDPQATSPDWQSQANRRRGEGVETSTAGRRMIEGTLRKGKLFGTKYYLEDGQGQRICRIDPKSPIGMMTFEQYIDRRAVFVGELTESNSELTLSVRSIRMR